MSTHPKARKQFAAISLCLLLLVLPSCTEMPAETEGAPAPADTTANAPAGTTSDTTAESETESEDPVMNTLTLSVNGHTLTAALENNSSADALVEMLKDGPVTIQMSDYGNMEKVGDIGTTLPTNDAQIHTSAGDLILYLGTQFVIYYDTNSWSLTRLGKIQDVTGTELKEILGNGDVAVTLSLAE